MKFYLMRLLFCTLLSLIVYAEAENPNKQLDSLLQGLKQPDLTISQRVKFLISVNESYEKLESFIKGKPFLDEALNIALGSGNIELVADVKAAYGKFYILSDNHVEALRLQLQALTIYESLKNEEKASNTLMYIGLSYYEGKNYKQAISTYKEAMERSMQANNRVRASTCKYLTALALLESEKLNEAYSLIKDIVSNTDTSLLSIDRKIECFIGLGDVFMKRNLNDSAFVYYQRAYQFYLTNENLTGQVYVGVKLSEVALRQNKMNLALSMSLTALRIADSIQSQKQRMLAIKVISDSYLKMKNFEKAYHYLNTYYALRDTVYNAENARKISNIQLKYELERKQHQINLLNKDQQQQAILKNALIIGCLLLLLLLIVSVHSITVNRKKNMELNKSSFESQQRLIELRSTQDQLIRQEKLASLGQMVAGISHEMQNPLNFVNNFSEVSEQLVNEYESTNDEQERKELMGVIKENISRIRDHGNRASGIVRSMLLYSHNNTFEKQSTDINTMLNDFIALAYEGLHAKDSKFNCRIEKKFVQLPLIQCVPQNISRVFLNLLTNAFYAVNEKKSILNEYYLPLVIISTSIRDNLAVISINDNGNGIPDSIKEKIFEPFFTTKPPGKGTGLGLSLSYDIVKAHGGSLNVNSKQDIFTEFIITLPIA